MSWSGVSVGSSCWELCATAILWDRVAPKHSSGLCGGFAAGWEEMAVTLWGGGRNGFSDFSVVTAICQDRWGWKHVCP